MSEAADRNGIAWKKPLIVLVLLAVAGLAAWHSPLREYLDPALTAAWLRRIGHFWWAPLLFIALYAVFNVFLLPATILTLSAGIVWGWLAGGLWVLLASNLASAAPYLIGRLAGSDSVERLVRKRAGGIYQALRDEGFTTLLLMRLVPIVPYNVLNYAAGVAGIRPADYFGATFVGTIPAIFIFTYLADSVAAGAISPRAAFIRVVIAGLLLGILFLSTRLLRNKLKRRIRHGER